MMSYTKHFTQLSNDGDWELSFDVEVETPEEAYTESENQSFIKRINNYQITYVGSTTAKLRGDYMTTTVTANGESLVQFRGSFLRHDISPGSDVTDIMDTDFALYYTRNFYTKHDASGVGVLAFTYDIKFTGDTMHATHTEIKFAADVELNIINVMGLPSTVMSDITKQALVNGSVAIRTRLLINRKSNGLQTLANAVETEERLILTEEDAVKTWELNDERYVPNVGFIGQFVSRTLNGELHNISDDFSIQDADVELQIGIVELGTRYQILTTENGRALVDEHGNKIYIKDLGADKTTWYTLGNFLVTKPEDDEVADNTSFEAFDYATKFNADFNADYADSIYPNSFNKMIESEGGVSLHWLASYTCAQVGVEFANDIFTNSDFIVPSNQFTQGESCRDVMKAISQIAFGWCRIGWDNKCYIDEPETTSTASDDTNTLTNDNYYSLTTQKEVYGPINRIVIGMSGITGQEAILEDSTSIEINGINDLLIMDNPILYTPELRESVKESGAKLLGLYYSPLETETPGHPWFKGNELIDVQDMEGNSRHTYPFNRTLSYTGHIKTKLISPATTNQEKETEYKQQLFKTIKDIGIKVDAQEGKINTVNATVEATKDGLSSIERRFETEITDTYSKTQIQEIINGTSADGTVVSSVTTTAGTFDKNGLTIEQTGSLTKTNINSNGMIIYNTSGTVENDKLLDVNSEGVNAKNIKVGQYLNIGSHSRMEDYTHTDYTQGTGVFWIGSDY